MKSFGVRLTAGLITILFGAYAAAVAQKDKQNSSSNWAAAPPSLGQPAAPIAGMNEESWITQPSTDPASAPRGFAANDALNSMPGAVAQVQYTEPADQQPGGFNLSSLPEGLGNPESSEPAEESQGMTIPDWTQGVQEAATEVAESITPTFTPDFAPQGAPQADVTANEAPEEQFGSQWAVDAPAEAANSAPQDEPAAAPQQFAVLPELSLDATEPMNIASQEASQPQADPSVAQNALAGQGFAQGQSMPAGNSPQNFLRGSADNANLLRGGDLPEISTQNEVTPAQFSQPSQFDPNQFDPSAVGNNTSPGGQASLAQNAGGFGQSAQQFNQPAPIQMTPAGLGAPLPSPASAAPQLNNAPPPRVASLPNSLPALPASSGLQGQIGGAGYPPTNFAQPTAAIAVDPNATVNLPGDRSLEGVQSPSVVIQKRAPREVKVGKPATFVIQVQNVGSAEALDVEVHDRIPAGMRLVDASPKPMVQGNQLLWQLGAMRAGDERTVTMQLIPEQEGELGSVARVSFEAAASVRTMSTRPELKIVQRAPETVMIGQQLEIELEVSNPGTGEALGVVLQEDVPEGLEHPRGRQLDNPLGNLAPGELRRQVLRLRAVAPGLIQNTIRLTGEDGLTAEHTVAVQVVSPELQVELAGPSRRFLERQATYNLNLANVGTADATNVQIAVHLDRGFSFVSAGNEGTYDSSQHTVFWELVNLPAGGTGSVPLTLLPIAEGQQSVTIDARADLGVVAKSERSLTVEGFAELSFSITNPGGPIELGSESIYEIRVTNDGSKPDSNVRVQLQLPAGLELLQSESQYQGDNRGLLEFQTKPQLMPGAEVVHRIRVRGVAPGTHLVKAVVVSDQSTVPVTKEESTLVYTDQ